MSEHRIDFVRKIVVVLVLGLVLSVSSLSIKTVNAQAGQVTLSPTDDTYVDSSNPNSNYGGQDYLEIIDTQSAVLNDISLVWLKFDLSSVPNGAVVDMASLQLGTYGHVLGTLNVHAYSCSDNSWTELTLTYSNMPSYNTTSMDSVLVASVNQWYNWSVVDAVRNALSGNPKSLTIVMQEPTPYSHLSAWFGSKENTVYSPTLTVYWSSLVPEFPTFLILPLFMIATLLGLASHKQSRHRKGSSQASRPS